ncbi:dihydrodipicolinate reductase [Tahibacter aquaticus]|uniref:4-hydroxy-tetrahydrodipicolinate reductase n=1 Tax=Tahibacter aquaticus TaxID=520092 RepID=A0A4R6YKC1_9GAMM|nr:4-hydroxy-tetrahydrodipicolinate reductase [Tahibacter aquaticus]TDR37387.1 dihydrodipicolinate reductase [Tahibacter aquaticus]
MTTDAAPIRLAVYGAGGRMGQAVLRAAQDCADVCIAAALVRAGSGLAGTPLPPLPPLSAGAAGEGEFVIAPPAGTLLEVVIDFSGVQGFDAALALALQHRAALVSGTTGLDAAQHVALDRAAEQIPVLWASNFSLGVALMQRFARMAAKVLPDWDCEIVEMHHRRKRDAPSGTALSLGEAVAQGRGVGLAEVAVHGRSGLTGARPAGQIGFHALRGGDVIGDHTVLFASDDERLELTHRAASRDLFARGALRAARRLARAQPGRYGMDDVLGE